MSIDFIQIIAIVGIIFGIFYSIILHEIAHGAAALMFGDRTALNARRLSLNPVPHIDPVGTLLPFIVILANLILKVSFPVFGWAKPVPINPRNFNNQRLGMIVVSLAGVTTNFILAALMYFLLSLTNLGLFEFIASINIMLMVFNLLPIPPLDGYNFIVSILPRNISEKFANNRNIVPIGFALLLALVVSGHAGDIYSPVYNILDTFFRAVFNII